MSTSKELLDQLQVAVSAMYEVKLKSTSIRSHNLARQKLFTLFNDYVKQLSLEAQSEINSIKYNIGKLVTEYINSSRLEELLNEKVTNINIELLPDQTITQISISKLGKM